MSGEDPLRLNNGRRGSQPEIIDISANYVYLREKKIAYAGYLHPGMAVKVSYRENSCDAQFLTVQAIHFVRGNSLK